MVSIINGNMLTKLTPVESLLSARYIWKKTGFPLVGGNDRGEDFFSVIPFSFFVIPAKAGIQYFISGVNYKGIKENSGFTLIEALMSMLILTVVLLGLLQAIIISADATTKNLLRDNAVNVAKQEIEAQRNIASISASGVAAVVTNSNYTVNSAIKNYNITYTLNRTITYMADSARVDLYINWIYKGQTYTYNTSTIIGTY
ncbi:MAG: prepilin-type N-terminal cleavage/methylation domain-containing protein [Nitrospirae bacterium]|nr:prepilin-type N-terminal cleavage/methylation domain-containing protein [Nitrospirota bacterium]MBF0519208.1 prepilin-type N-terminal cleavage/methylation domain-containing protein [Nitrospirota bacterium]MBF0534883.1 prepilin-type N-terminal cleavage/methylation domain-containing protein [Nitrospirota bacterium]MBF0616798.1 prepilin-type N-terminal cleavage/methylation domain-containing protein [Nitrospirota bacterium]